MSEPNYCLRHPDEETTLRCSKCDAFICTRCAVWTSVGYRCSDCSKPRKVSSSAAATKVIAASIVGFTSGLIASYFLAKGFLLLILFLAGIVGGVVGELVFRILDRRASSLAGSITAAGFFAGALITPIARALSEGGAGFQADVTAVLFAAISGGVAWLRLR